MKLASFDDVGLGDWVRNVIWVAVERILPFDALDNVVLLRFTGPVSYTHLTLPTSDLV